MPTYIGFSTQEVNVPRTFQRAGIDGGPGTITREPYLGKKFRLVDEQLVLRDFINSFNIKQGDKVGQPGYGTTIWDKLFEINDTTSISEIEAEVRRVASLDSRVQLNTVSVYPYENGVLIEVQISFEPFNNVIQFGFILNRDLGVAQAMSVT